MPTFTRPILKILVLLVFAGLLNGCENTQRMHEVPSVIPAPQQAPPECQARFREFFGYLLGRDTNIVTDQAAQNRFFSEGFRRSFTDYLNSIVDPGKNPNYPKNGTFVGVWNYPTTYSVVGTRHYDYRNGQNPDGNRAVIDVLYEWDEHGSLDNQYPGSKSLHSFHFVYENGGWKLADIYSFGSASDAGPSSLRAYFERQTPQ